MSSENFNTEDAVHYRWHDALSADEYAVATYLIETVVPPEDAAVAIAREQSAPILRILGASAEAVALSTARVVTVEELGEADGVLLPPFLVQTRSYPDRYGGCPHRARIRIAFPSRNFGSSLTGLWNSVVGEVHRLGFLTAVRLEDVELPAPLLVQMPGPLHGVPGLRKTLGMQGRPLFCRAARPAKGLSTDEMTRINKAVLTGGFDAVKDDELTYDTPLSPFRERVTRMMNMVRRVEDATGERKLYFANVIDDLAKAFELADFAVQAGVTGILAAPALQGITISACPAYPTTARCYRFKVELGKRHKRYGRLSGHRERHCPLLP